MADKKQTASGAAGGGNDTSFRKTYDRAEYAAKAKESERKRKEDGAKYAEAKASGKAWHRAATPEDMKDTSHRVERLDVAANVGRVTLVPAGGQGKRGRGAGFYCSHCVSLSFSLSPTCDTSRTLLTLNLRTKRIRTVIRMSNIKTLPSISELQVKAERCEGRTRLSVMSASAISNANFVRSGQIKL